MLGFSKVLPALVSRLYTRLLGDNPRNMAVPIFRDPLRRGPALRKLATRALYLGIVIVVAMIGLACPRQACAQVTSPTAVLIQLANLEDQEISNICMRKGFSLQSGLGQICIAGYQALRKEASDELQTIFGKGQALRPRLSGSSHAEASDSSTSAFAPTLETSVPTLPFLGNWLTVLSYVPNANTLADLSDATVAYAVGLTRQSDCSLDEAYVLPGAGLPAAEYLTSLTGAQDAFHQLAGLTTKPDVFANGCAPQVLGLPATGIGLSLGSTSGGAAITAQLADAGLFVTITDLTANTSKTTQLTVSPTNGFTGYFSAASLRNNGIMDLVETHVTDPKTSAQATAVFLGNGDGTFQAGVYYDVADTSGNVASFTIDDVTGDGIPDIVIPVSTSITNNGIPNFTGTVTTLIGKGDGTFTTGPVSNATWTNSLLPVTGVFKTGDVKDLLIGGTVLFGSGNGAFTVGPTSAAIAGATFSNLIAGAVGDVNKDGKLDVVVSNTGTVAIFYGNGDGTFQTGPVYAALPDQEQVTITDIDGDGNPDIVLGTSTGGVYTEGGYDTPLPMFQILMGRGDGTFVDSLAYQGPYSFINGNEQYGPQFASADFNGDGKADVLVFDASNVGGQPSSFLVLPGDGKGNLGKAIASSANLIPTEIVSADMNGDGKPDAVLAGSVLSGPQLSVLINQGNGTFAGEKDYALPTSAVSLAVGDFNGDGLMDVAVGVAPPAGGSGASGVFVLLGKAGGTLGAPVQIDSSLDPTGLAAGDINGDGRTDLVVADQGNLSTIPGALHVYLGNADGTFTTKTAPTTTATSYTEAAIGDLNNDGKLDLIVTGGIPGTLTTAPVPSIYTLLGNGDGTFQKANALTLADSDEFSTSIALADFDKSGNLGVTVGNPADYTEVLLGNGDGTLTETLPALGQRPYALGVADLLGNGYPELLVGTAKTLTVLQNMPGAWTAATTLPSTTTTLTTSAGTITAGASVTFTATVAGASGSTGTPGGTVTFMDGTTTLGTGTLSSSGVATYATTALPVGSDSITAVYGGSTSFSGSTSAAVTVTVTAVVVNPSFAVSSSGNITVSPGATTGNTATISATGSNGFSGAVSLSCAVSPAAASGSATCSLSPTSVTISGATAQTSTLTISTTAATSAALSGPGHPKSGGVPWYAAGGATLACVLLFGIPARRRGWRAMLGMLILLAFLTGGLSSCGGAGSSGGSSGGTRSGTTAGTYTVTVTGTSGSTTKTTAVTLTVN